MIASDDLNNYLLIHVHFRVSAVTVAQLVVLNLSFYILKLIFDL